MMYKKVLPLFGILAGVFLLLSSCEQLTEDQGSNITDSTETGESDAPAGDIVSKTEHMEAIPAPNGIKLRLQGIDGTWIRITEKESGLKYLCYEQILSSTDVPWMFTEKGKSYTFVLNYTSAAGKWIDETVTCVAGGGNDNILLKSEDFSKIPFSYSEIGGARIIRLNSSLDQLLTFFTDTSPLDGVSFVCAVSSGIEHHSTYIESLMYRLSPSPDTTNMSKVFLGLDLMDNPDRFRITSTELDRRLSVAKQVLFEVTLRFEYKDASYPGNFQFKSIIHESIYTPVVSIKTVF